jgi:hypothetical protein
MGIKLLPRTDTPMGCASYRVHMDVVYKLWGSVKPLQNRCALSRLLFTWVGVDVVRFSSLEKILQAPDQVLDLQAHSIVDVHVIHWLKRSKTAVSNTVA